MKTKLNTYFIPILIFICPLQIPIIGGYEVSGVTLNSLKDLVVLSVMLLSLIKIKFLVVGKEIKILFQFLVVVLIFSLILSPDIKSGLQYLIKILFPFVAYIYCRSIILKNSKFPFLLRNVIVFYIAYIILSLFYGYAVGDTQSGLTDRHYFKFNAVFLFLISLSTVLFAKYRILGLIGLCVSLFALLIIMQRGALISIVIGSFFLLYIFGYFSIRRILLILPLIIFSIFMLFQNKSFIEYSFYEGKGPEYIITQLKQGKLDSSVIRDRERGVLLSAMLEGYNISALPGGLGEAKRRVQERYWYFGGKEPHNDWVVLLIDLGIIGCFMIFMLFLLLSFASIRQLKEILYVRHFERTVSLSTGLAMVYGMLIWMMFSNVLIYSSSALVLPLALMGLAVNNRKNLISSGIDNGKNKDIKDGCTRSFNQRGC